MLEPDFNALQQHYPDIAYLPPNLKTEVIAQVLVALANQRGGLLVLGLRKNGRPQRLLQPSRLQDEIMRAALSCDPPLIIPSPRRQNYEGHTIILCEIPPDLPHVYNIDGRYLIWEDEQPAPLRGGALRQLIFARGEGGFDGLLMPTSTPDDLDWAAVQAYLAQTDSLRDLNPEEALIKRGCLKRNRRQLQPTRAGLLLFGKAPQQWLPQAQITVARYTGLQMSDAFTRADISGTLPEQIRQVEAFILENIGQRVRLDAFQRTEGYLYPLTAVRELVVNAIAHRDYSIPGDHIRILLFANRLEVYSPGRLPGHVTVNNLTSERFSRNATLVQVLFDFGFIERLGYGIDRILHSIDEWGMAQPRFEETAGGFNVTLFNLNNNAGSTGTSQARAWLEMGLNQRQVLAMNFLTANGRITNADFQNLCPNVSPETLRRDLAGLVSKNLLLRIGEKRATFYIEK